MAGARLPIARGFHHRGDTIGKIGPGLPSHDRGEVVDSPKWTTDLPRSRWVARVGAGSPRGSRLHGLAAAATTALRSRAMGRKGKGGRTVLIVDDDPQFCAAAERWRSEDTRVVTASGIAEAHAHVRAEQPFLAIIDWCLGGGVCGADLIAPLRRVEPALQIALASAALTTARTVFAIKAGADLVIDKPFVLTDVVRQIEQGIALRDLAAPPQESLAAVEAQHIGRVIAETQGNLARAARRLGVSRNRIKRFLDSLPPPPGDARPRTMINVRPHGCTRARSARSCGTVPAQNDGRCTFQAGADPRRTERRRQDHVCA